MCTELVQTGLDLLQVWCIQVQNVESTYLHLYLLHIEVLYIKMIISVSKFQIWPSYNEAYACKQTSTVMVFLDYNRYRAKANI